MTSWSIVFGPEPRLIFHLNATNSLVIDLSIMIQFLISRFLPFDLSTPAIQPEEPPHQTNSVLRQAQEPIFLDTTASKTGFRTRSILRSASDRDSPLCRTWPDRSQWKLSQRHHIATRNDGRPRYHKCITMTSTYDPLTLLPTELLIKVIASLPDAAIFLDLCHTSSKLRRFMKAHAAAICNSSIRINFPEEARLLEAKLVEGWLVLCSRHSRFRELHGGDSPIP